MRRGVGNNTTNNNSVGFNYTNDGLFLTKYDGSTASVNSFLSVLNDGKIGIGKNEPTVKLDIDGSVKIRDSLNITNDLTIDDNIEAEDLLLRNDLTVNRLSVFKDKATFQRDIEVVNNSTFKNDLIIEGDLKVLSTDSITLKTNALGAILVANGDKFNSVNISNHASMDQTGALSLNSGVVVNSHIAPISDIYTGIDISKTTLKLDDNTMTWQLDTDKNRTIIKVKDNTFVKKIGDTIQGSLNISNNLVVNQNLNVKGVST